MNLPQVVDSNGRAVPLERQLASGGEGAVYLISNGPHHVAKVYHKPPTPQTEEKLQSMVALANPNLLEFAAWPSSILLFAKTRGVAGFVMPRLVDCQPIQQLYNPVMRLKSFPRAGWAFQVHTAINLAAAFDEVHKAGCLVGDVNQSNAQVSPQAIVKLIDCDSFQVRANGKQFLCEVGTPHYTPPELQGKHLRGLTRTENHDRFGLAVLIYQLLVVGRHPYMGIYHGKGDPSFEQLIAEYRFAQGPGAASWQMAPPPHTPTFDDLPPDVGSLFRRAFERGSEIGNRPKPSEWLSALPKLKSELVTCGADSGHQHWKGARGCVWCRLAQRGGPEYYYGVAVGSGQFVVDDNRLQQILRKLTAAQAAICQRDVAQYASSIRPSGTPLPASIAQLRADWNRSQDECDVQMQERQRIESEELLKAQRRESQRIQKIKNSLNRQMTKLDEEIAQEEEAIDAIYLERRTLRWVLTIAIGLGLVTVPLGCVHVSFAVFGLCVVGVFGCWLAIQTLGSPAVALRRRIRVFQDQQTELQRAAENSIKDARRETALTIQALRQQTDELLRNPRQLVKRLEAMYRSQLVAEETTRRRQRDATQSSLVALERAWDELNDRYVREHREIEQTVRLLVANCQALDRQYQTELSQMTATAKDRALLRHLRLNLIADANIPQIGEGRKQILAGYNINSAEDIDENVIRSIRGFGDSLTSNLLAWRNQVIRDFRFDPKTAISSGELAVLSGKYKATQERLLNEISQQLPAIEKLTSTYQASIKRLLLELKQAAAIHEQSLADWRVIAPTS